MPLLAFLGPLKCVCRVVTAFFMAFLIFPAAAETASPPISGSNGLMGLWGANSSAPQTGSSGKPISGSNEQQGATAPGTPTESSPPSADSQDAELESSPPSAPRNVVPPPISGSNGLMGEWGANSSQPQSGKPISGSNDQQDTTAPGIPTESSPPSADAQDAELKSSPQDAELKSSPPDAELESSPPSAPRNVAPSPSAQSGSNGLIEWSANSSELQTGSSGKPISGSNDQQGATAPGTPTELSPPSADAQDAELDESTGCRAQVESTGCRARVESTKRATKCRAFAQCSIRFQWTDRVERKQLGIADGLQWKADQRFKRPTGRHCSWHSNRVEPTKRRFTGCRA